MARTLVLEGAAFAVAIAVLATPSASDAQASFTAQDRSVASSSTSFGDVWDVNSSPFFPDFDPPTLSLNETATDDAAASDMGLFDATAATTDPPLIAVAPSGSATASQTSSLFPSQVSAIGSFDAVGHSRILTQAEIDLANAFLNPPVPYGSGLLGDNESGTSSFSASFDITVPTPYVFAGSVSLSPVQRIDDIEGFEITNGSADIVLDAGSWRVAISIDQADCSPPTPCEPGDRSFNVSGTLPPGSYTITAHASGAAAGLCTEVLLFECHEPTANGSFEFSLTLGAPPPPEVPLLPPLGVPVLAALLVASGLALRRPARR